MRLSEARERIKDYCDMENVTNPESGISVPYEMVDALLVEFAQFEAENAELKQVLTSDETLEILADIEHERWSSWMQWMFDHWTDKNIARWKQQMLTPYADLPEHSKESDRKEARKTLAAIRKAKE